MKKLIFTGLLWLLTVTSGKAQEIVFAGYFDVATGSPENTEVTGRIHLESNKEAPSRKIPAEYRFEILRQDDRPLFRVETQFDAYGRIMGVFRVDEGENTGLQEKTCRMEVALKSGSRTLQTFPVAIHITRQTLWELCYERYLPMALSQGRLYGSKRLSDEKVARLIRQVTAGNGRFQGFSCYRPLPLKFQYTPKQKNPSLKPLDDEWIQVCNLIGGMGRAYCLSKVYGAEGDPQARKALKEALYQALLAYTSCVPIEGDDVLINGQPIGKYTGDGISLLHNYGLMNYSTTTHQWKLSDPLVVPALALMPDILEGIRQNDSTSLRLHQSLIRYFQLFTSITEKRREIDNPEQRWGNLTDTLYSAGAWADANLGHRSRTLLALPLIWGDYNRPVTYVPYWYSSFYHNPPFKDFSFSPGWSPHGVMADVSQWMTKFGIPAHRYGQSGFHPDGTVSHHIGHGTDAAMVAYGFEWLTDCSHGFSYFKDTDFRIDSPYYQFQLDRLLEVYPFFFYKGQMDFLVAGRSYLSDLKKFVSKTYLQAVKALEAAQSRDTRLENLDKLKAVAKEISKNRFECSGTRAYWVNEFLIHRRGAQEKPFYASLKLKSERTVGIEDFSKVRKSWHGGYGILQLKVRGDEYDQQVLSNMDWHALPGLTEEWRNDPLPAEGGSQASLPGANKVAGVLADGTYGMGIYHHLPQETYSSATALKSYYFLEDRILALGSHIQRLREGQGQAIHTFIDQSEFRDTLTWYADGRLHQAVPGESVAAGIHTTKPCWIHTGEKGYIVLPSHRIRLQIRTGKEIHVTDREIADGTPNFIVALEHGIHPGKEDLDDRYAYLEIPNVSAAEMPQRLREVLQDLEYRCASDSIHGVFSRKEQIRQYAFFAPGSLCVGGTEIRSEAPAIVMLKEDEAQWTLSVGNPAPDGERQTLRFWSSTRLPAGNYAYTPQGVNRVKGEYIRISDYGTGSEVTVELPDSRDASQYHYQSELYAASPLIIRIPKTSGSVEYRK